MARAVRARWETNGKATLGESKSGNVIPNISRSIPKLCEARVPMSRTATLLIPKNSG